MHPGIAGSALGRSGLFVRVRAGLCGAEAGEKGATTKWQSNYFTRGSWRRVVGFL